MITIKNIQVGDELRIVKKPSKWSSALEGKFPFENENHIRFNFKENPYRIIIAKKDTLYYHTVINCHNGYGWNLNSLIDEECIDWSESRIKNTYNENIISYY